MTGRVLDRGCYLVVPTSFYWTRLIERMRWINHFLKLSRSLAWIAFWKDGDGTGGMNGRSLHKEWLRKQEKWAGPESSQWNALSDESSSSEISKLSDIFLSKIAKFHFSRREWGVTSGGKRKSELVRRNKAPTRSCWVRAADRESNSGVRAGNP